MTATPPHPELLHALGKLARGLSAIFWGLPIALIVCVQTAKTNFFEIGGWAALFFPLFSTGLLFYGLNQMTAFQPQERIWIASLERGKIVSLVMILLTPFLGWYHKLPEVPYYASMLNLLILLGLLFLLALNDILNRLAAMLPDETVRLETRFFTTMNRYLLYAVPFCLGLLALLSRMNHLPRIVIIILTTIEPLSHWLFLLMLLLPLSLTMTMLWKLKEVILTSVFGREL